MLLAVDVGNTNTVFAIYQGDTLRGQWRIVTDAHRTADEYVVWLEQLLSLKSMSINDITDMVISTVVPAVLFNLQKLAETYLGKEPLVVGAPNVNLGLKIRIDEPSSVGADRLANAVGAHIKYPGDLILIDYGTATTLDVIGEDGSYEGGIIAPGVALSLNALHKAAAKLPIVAIEEPENVIGTDTTTAMQSGIYWGYVCLIEGLIERIKQERGQHLKVIATGGLSNLFDHGTEVIDHVDEDLTIEGLREIFRRNTSTSG